jgi:hypothetical protein
MFRPTIFNAAADDDDDGDDPIGLKLLTMEQNKSYWYSNIYSFVGLPYMYFRCGNSHSAIRAAGKRLNGNEVSTPCS